MPAPDAPQVILATDCGSTTTKAILIEKQGDIYRLACRGEAPTTVEAPFDDVTVGVSNAVREIEELSGRVLLDSAGKVLVREAPSVRGKEAPPTPQVWGEETPQPPSVSPIPAGTARSPESPIEHPPPRIGGQGGPSAPDGVDLYLSTSSAGGGLQMTVTGVVKSMSAESAQRAALGAGAVIMDVIAVDDGRKDFQKVERIRALRPDMILMSGGTDGGTVAHLTETAEMLRSADPKPRLGVGLKLPVIYAGNVEARPSVHEVLDGVVSLRDVPNLRPTMDTENLAPAREAIHDLFLEHVMQQAPGYAKLMTWTSADILSTPNAVGLMMETVAREQGLNILGVDIGGATTDVFSVFGGHFHRTVSANLGMSYSICNVLAEAGLENILRWLPFAADPISVRNSLRNKMIRPTTIPQTWEDLQTEQAVAREALRLALLHHKSLARGLKGVQTRAGIEMERAATGQTLVDMMALNMLIGSGGVLSHAPLRAQTSLMLLDAYEPVGVTTLAVDSIFMMPQLGVLSTVLPEAATQVFDRDCLIKLGDCLAPLGTGKDGEPCLTVSLKAGGTHAVPFGELRLLPLPPGETDTATVTPAKAFDVGAGKGKPHTVTVEGGAVGLFIDCRGRPLSFAPDAPARAQKAQEALRALGLPVLL